MRLETDKVTVEVPAPAGTLGEIVAAEGDTVGVDALLATLTEGAGAAPASTLQLKHPLLRPLLQALTAPM